MRTPILKAYFIALSIMLPISQPEIWLASPARADYHYVSHTGSDTYPYTSWETAADSIMPAIIAAEPYDSIFIAAGEFEEAIFASNPADTCLTFIGAGAESTVVWQDVTINNWLSEDKTMVRDMCFRVIGEGTGFGGYIGADITALHCRFEGGVGVFPHGYTVVEDCEFYDVETAVLASGQGLIFRNNFFHSAILYSIFEGNFHVGRIENNVFLVPHPYVDTYFSQFNYYHDSLIVRNNFIDQIGHGPNVALRYESDIANNSIGRIFMRQPILNEAFEITADWDSLRAKIRNNVVLEADYGVKVYDWGGPDNRTTIAYNCFWACSVDVFSNRWERTDTANNIQAFPMFQNPDSFDYRLQAFSPLIDAGDPNMLDIDGTRSDIGVFGGPGGSSYPYQDLAPRIPDSLAYRVWNDTVYLFWRHNYETDFFGYRLHRDIVQGFTPSPANLLAEPEDPSYADPVIFPGQVFYYRVAAVDSQGNRSEYSKEIAVAVTGTWQGDGAELPRMTVIESNYPNPFNSSTMVVYAVANLGPIPAQINIDIYDIQGRKVRSLIDERKEVGTHQITWDGKDDAGNDLSSGIYFARITQWHVEYMSRSKKLVLLR